MRLGSGVLSMSSNNQQPLLFGPATDQPDATSLLVDLDDLFAGKYGIYSGKWPGKASGVCPFSN